VVSHAVSFELRDIGLTICGFLKLKNKKKRSCLTVGIFNWIFGTALMLLPNIHVAQEHHHILSIAPRTVPMFGLQQASFAP
jgi:hypothetical protein